MIFYVIATRSLFGRAKITKRRAAANIAEYNQE
jgi:hypothetical protein